MEAVTAYLNLKKAEKILQYSQKPAYNTASVTYSKQAEKMIYAKNKAVRIFNMPVEEISALKPTDISFDTLPASVEEAKQTALRLNPDIMIFYFNVKAAEAKIAAQKSDSFFPKISAEAGSTFKKDSSSKLSGHFGEHYAGLKLNYSVNLEGNELNTVKTLRQEYISAVKKYEAKKKEISEQVKNAFANFINSTKQAKFLEKQKNPIGTASAKTDETIAAFALLESIGKLDTDKLSHSSVKQNIRPAPLKFHTVESLIDVWAMAWVKKKIGDYISCYADNFIPAGNISRQQWANIRKKRLEAPDFIEIAIDITKKEILSPDTVLITFTQKYKSNLYKDVSIKNLTLKFKDNCWKIIREEAANI